MTTGPATGFGTVVLAAGLSTRFGSEPKQLFVVEGESLVRRAARAALSCRADHSVLVLGHCSNEVGAELQREPALPIETVLNPAYREGQATSVICGLRHLARDLRAVMFLPCDQPWVDGAFLDRIFDAFERAETAAPIVVPSFAGRRGSPVLFPSDLFAELRELTGDQGGRPLLEKHEKRVLLLEIPSEKPLIDIDRPDIDRADIDRPDLDR